MIIPYGEHRIDLTPPWRRVTMADLVKEKSGIDFETLMACGKSLLCFKITRKFDLFVALNTFMNYEFIQAM